MCEVKIKIADATDAVYIALIGRVTFADYFKSKKELIEYLNQTFSVIKIRESISNKTENIYWLATYNELPVGYAKLKLNSSYKECGNEGKVCQLQKIYVLKDFISMKIGLSLLEQLLGRAVELGYENIWLSVLKENLRAVAFYMKSLFLINGEHIFRIGSQDFYFFRIVKILDKSPNEKLS